MGKGLRTVGIGLVVFACGALAGAWHADSGGGGTEPARASAAVAKSYHLRMTATAYCLRGRTASGTSVGWGTVAVDPRFIPLGSRLHVSGYGTGQALDTGPAIRGAIIDVWMDSCAAAMRWGRRPVVVTVYR